MCVCLCVNICVYHQQTGTSTSILQMWRQGSGRKVPYLVWISGTRSQALWRSHLGAFLFLPFIKKKWRISAPGPVDNYSKTRTWRLASCCFHQGLLLAEMTKSHRELAWPMSPSVTSHCWRLPRDAQGDDVVLVMTLISGEPCLFSHPNWNCQLWVLLSVSLPPQGLGEVKQCPRKVPLPKCDLRRPVSVNDILICCPWDGPFWQLA